MTPSSQLLLVKQVFTEAGFYVERGNPVSCGMAISMLQDAAELYIWTVIKDRGIPAKQGDGFVAHINSLQKAGLSVPDSAKLLDLNTARIGFKHYGNLPDPAEAKKHQTYVEDFLKSAMLEHFQVSFDELSLVDLVADTRIKTHLKAAEQKIEAGAFDDAAKELKSAKTLVFSKLDGYIPNVDRKLSQFDHVFMTKDEFRGIIKPFAYLTEYLNSFREALLVVALHLPVDDYNFLRDLFSSFMLAGMWAPIPNKSHYGEQECRRAIRCLVNFCLRLEHL